MTEEELKLIGVVLYKCEGSKLRYNRPSTIYYGVEFTNSDPQLIKLFIKFLRKIIATDEKRIRCELFIYDDINRLSIEKYWSRITSIPLTQFHKTIILKAKNSKYKPNPLGTMKLRYVDKRAFLKLNQLIIEKLGNQASLFSIRRGRIVV